MMSKKCGTLWNLFFSLIQLSMIMILLSSLVLIVGCSDSGGDKKPSNVLIGYDGFDSHSGNSGLEFYSQFPWFVNVTCQVENENGWGVSSLKVSDFQVTEDAVVVDQVESEMNIRQRDTLPSSFTYKLRTVLLLDNTPSSAVSLEKIKESALIIVENIDEKGQQQIAVVSFDESGDPKLYQGFTPIIGELSSAINNIEVSYGTSNFYGAVIYALSLWENDHSSNGNNFLQGLLIALTDGQDTSDLFDLEDAMTARQDKKIYTVAVGQGIPESVLADLEELGNAGFYHVPDPNIEADEKNDETENLCETTYEIQQKILAYADAFYWLRYKSKYSDISVNPNPLLILSIEGKNKNDISSIEGNFNTDHFNSEEDGIFFNATSADPNGITEKVITIKPGEANVSSTISAITLAGDSQPAAYEWRSNDDNIVTVSADSNDSSKAVISVVAPGQTTIIATDTVNGFEKSLTITVRLSDPLYEFVRYAVQSEAPWFVDATVNVRNASSSNNQWQWVNNLLRENFSILENNLPVDLDASEINLRKRDNLPSGYEYELKTVLLIDNSPSIGDNLDLIKVAAKAFVHRALINDPDDNTDSGPLLKKGTSNKQQSIAVWTYNESGDSLRMIDFSSNEQNLITAINSIARSYGTTDFYGGLIDCLNSWEFDMTPRPTENGSPLRQGAVIAITDGYSTLGFFETAEAVTSQIGNKQLIMVGVGDDLLSSSNIEDLKLFGNSGYYSVPDPGNLNNITLTSDDGVNKITVNRSDLEETLIDIQENIFDFANSFYWINYKSYVTESDDWIDDCERRENVKITIKDNSNTNSGSAFETKFISCDFFEAEDNRIYINPTSQDPWGEDGPMEVTYYVLSDSINVISDREDYELKAFTYNHQNQPSYEWSSSNENVAKIEVDVSSYGNSTAYIVLPSDPVAGSALIRVVDVGNGGTFKIFSVTVLEAFLDPILYYPFNGNAMDVSGNNYHGDIYGATLTSDIDGNINSAYFLDGVDDYIAINDLHYGSDATAYSEEINSLTVCLMFNTIQTRSPRLLEFNAENYFSLTMGGGVVGWFTTSGLEEYNSTIGSPSIYNDGNWHFVCATYDFNPSVSEPSKSLYVDGILIDTKRVSGSIGTGMTSYGFIGKHYRNAVNYEKFNFNGRLDEVMIFDEALDVDEIEALSQYFIE